MTDKPINNRDTNKLLSVEEVEAYANAIIGKDFNAPKLLPVRIAIQLADTIRENERLREALPHG